MKSLIFNRVKMKNFQSYIESDISLVKGSNLIYGINGSGKSSIIRAISSSLFQSKSTKKHGLNISDLVMNNKESSKAFLYFSYGDNDYTIKWFFSQDGTDKCHLKINNNKDINGVRDVREFLESKGITSKKFFDFYVRQRKIDIIDRLSKSGRKEMIDDVLGLDEIDRYNDKLKYSRREVKSELSSVNGSFSEIKNQRDNLYDNNEEINNRIEMKKDELENIEREISEKEPVIDSFRGDIGELRSKLKSISQKDVDEVEKKIEEKEEDISSIKEEIRKIKRSIKNKKNKKKKYEEELDNLDKPPTISTLKQKNNLIILLSNTKRELKGIEIPEISIENFDDLNKVVLSKVKQPIMKRHEKVVEDLGKLKSNRDRVEEIIEEKKQDIEDLKTRDEIIRNSLEEDKNKIAEELKSERNIKDKPIYFSILYKLKEIIGLSKKRKRIKKILNNIEKSNKSVLEDKKYIKQINQSLNNKIRSLEENKKELDNIKRKIEKNHRNIEDMENQLYNYNEKIDIKKNKKRKLYEIISAIQEWENKQKEYSRLKNKVGNLENKISELSSTKEDKENNIKEKKENIRIGNERIEGLSKPKKIRDKIADKKEDLTNKREELKSLKEKKSKRKQKLLELKQKKKDIDNIQERLENIRKSKKELIQTKQEINNLISFNNQIKNRKRKNSLSKIQKNTNILFKKTYNLDKYTKLEIDNNFGIKVKTTEGSYIKPKQLSGGEKIVISIAIRSSICKTIQEYSGRIKMPLILDEPTYNLDKQHSMKLKELIDDLEKWFSQVIIISHDENIIKPSRNMLKTTIKDGTSHVKNK